MAIRRKYEYVLTLLQNSDGLWWQHSGACTNSFRGAAHGPCTKRSRGDTQQCTRWRHARAWP